MNSTTRPATFCACDSYRLPLNTSGQWCFIMPPQEPEGTTIGQFSGNRSSWALAISKASFGCPDVKAGWPQQLCAIGKCTRMPCCSISVIASIPASGMKMSSRHVPKKYTSAGLLPTVGSVFVFMVWLLVCVLVNWSDQFYWSRVTLSNLM